MTVLTLLVKARGAGQLKLIDDLLKAEFKDLEVEPKVLGVPSTGGFKFPFQEKTKSWLQTSLTGKWEPVP